VHPLPEKYGGSMILGIDPGQTGAIAFMDRGKVVAMVDMPTMGRTYGKGQQVDPYELASLMIEHGGVHGTAVMEQVGAMPGQGSVSMLNFGESIGIVKGVLGALQIPVRFVTPQRWKKAAGLIGKDKDAARTLAIQLHPEIAGELTRKRDIGRADAICIAHFG
jgi:crossover junction endodeoxyribonuclease RuvC